MATVENYTKFKLVNDFRNSLITNEIETNMKYWLDWCFLGLGAWNDVYVDTTSGAYGRMYELQLVNDEAYTDGTVWQSPRGNWVWETGVEFDNDDNNPEPIEISGVYIDDVFYTGGDATYSHYYDYNLGRIIFNTESLTSSQEVEVEHSYRYVQVYRADDAPWFRELQFASLKPGEEFSHFFQQQSGDWTIGGQHRIQLPAVVIEAVSKGDSEGYELGNVALNVRQDVLFHVFAESRADRNNIIDILRYQSDKTIWLFNSNTMALSGDFPLDYRGMLTGTKMYPDWVETPENGGYRWRTCRFSNNNISEIAAIHPNLYEGVVRSTLEIVIGDI